MITTSNYFDEKKQYEVNEIKHNAASTSIESYAVVNATGQRLREKEIVLNAIAKHQPITSRALSQITQIERSNICRSIFDLVHDSQPQVKEWQTAKCPITGRRVKTYVLISYQQAKLF